jgi:hypothetical protein
MTRLVVFLIIIILLVYTFFYEYFFQFFKWVGFLFIKIRNFLINSYIKIRKNIAIQINKMRPKNKKKEILKSWEEVYGKKNKK